MRRIPRELSPRARRQPLKTKLAALAISSASLLASCNPSGAHRGSFPDAVRVGLFPNLTHAPAILCVAGRYFEEYLGSAPARSGRIDVKLFESGPQAVEAIYSGSIDFAYLGPSPALNGFLRSGGKALRVVAGSTSGGASFVVQPEITSAAGLQGRVLATPQLGNTQDVALRTWLAANSVRTDPRGGGDVTIAPQPGSQIFDGFRQGQIAGAWVPEPWASRLVVEAGGRVLVDERDLWPGGLFTTTVAVATPEFTTRDPAALEALLRAHLDCVDRLTSTDSSILLDARQAVGTWLARTAGRVLPAEVVERAWGELTFTADPLSDTIVRRAIEARAMGLLPAFDEGQIADLFDPGPLRQAERSKTSDDRGR